ncbi:MAG: isochorismatase family protein [Candidatus Thermoplasmatota archaeon]|nr:isochorismatase family protein [Candidatus Thermoplasmatota archaeon]
MVKKGEYVTAENLSIKALKWLKALELYNKSKSFQLVPRSSALLVIDMQNFFLDSNSHAFIPAAKAIVPNVLRLLEGYRKNQYCIIFTRYGVKEDEGCGIMKRWWKDNVKEGSYYSKIISLLKPGKGEFIVRKTRYSGFYNTQLENILKARDIKSIVITGVMTNLCCETIAREAFTRDLEVYFVIDATATVNEELHLASLKTLAHGFAIPKLTEEILAVLNKK